MSRSTAWLAVLTLIACAPEQKAQAPMTLSITSPAFAPGAAIPTKHTCEGPDLSPPLAWTGVPDNARSLALVVDDPDAPDPAAPKVVWVHWVVYDIPPGSTGLAANAARTGTGGRDGVNDWKAAGWRGPCPPMGRHRYFFKLFALDTPLGDLHQPTKAQLEKAMEGHILARGELIGTYQQSR